MFARFLAVLKIKEKRQESAPLPDKDEMVS
jgi:hypothetical protein